MCASKRVPISCYLTIPSLQKRLILTLFEAHIADNSVQNPFENILLLDRGKLQKLQYVYESKREHKTANCLECSEPILHAPFFRNIIYKKV